MEQTFIMIKPDGVQRGLRQYDRDFLASSFNDTHISDQATTEGLWSGRSTGTGHTREAILRELVKESIREEILTKELERCQGLLEAEAHRSREMMTARQPTQFGAEMARHGQPFPPENRRIPLSFSEMYHNGNRGDSGGFDVVTHHHQHHR